MKLYIPIGLVSVFVACATTTGAIPVVLVLLVGGLVGWAAPDFVMRGKTK